MSEKACNRCQYLIDQTAKSCPHCGFAYPTKDHDSFTPILVAVTFVLLISCVFIPFFVAALIWILFFAWYIKTIKDIDKAQKESLFSCREIKILNPTAPKKKQLVALWICDLKPTVADFTYNSNNKEKTRRTATFERYFKSGNGMGYFEAYCHNDGFTKTFKSKNISSKLKVGADYYFPADFVTQFRIEE